MRGQKWHLPPPYEPSANPQDPAGQILHVSEFSPFMFARVPGGFVPIPQHIRPFLDTTHQPTEGGLVPDSRRDTRQDVDIANDYYYKIRRLSPVRHPATNRVLSAYSGVELKPNSRFAGHQFDEYVFHAIRKGRLFMFRVEKQAPLTGNRHPRGLESTRCRFARCPVDGTIRPGQVRVCISEFLDPENKILDPYQNACYVHLYCLEHFSNLPSLLTDTNVTFLPAGQLAKEAFFAPALNPTEREVCLQWVSQARQSWRDFKRAFPSPERRPQYQPADFDRLYHRLDKLRETHKKTNKRPREEYNGPQVYTYNNQGQRNPAPEPAPKKPRTVPPRIAIPDLSQRFGVQICHGAPGQPTSFRPMTIKFHGPSFPFPGDTLPSGLAEGAQPQLGVNGADNPGQSAEYTTEEIDAMLVEYYADEFSNYPGPGFEEVPSHDPATPPPVAGSQEGAGPEEGTQPEQSHRPMQAGLAHDNQPATSVKIPVVTEGRRKSRRSSAPPVLSVQNARVRKRSAPSRRGSKTEHVPVTELDL